MRNLLASLALAALSLIATLTMLEASVRLFFPESRWRFEDGTGDWRLDDEIGWVHRPDLDLTTETLLGTVRFRTNADGLVPSDAHREKPPGALRVMLFGDSMLVGRWLPQEETYSARLESILRERGLPADVVNAGVQGHSTDQALLLMQRWVPAYRPDVVIYGSTLNDLGGNGVDEAWGIGKPVFQLDGRERLRLTLPRPSAEIRQLGIGPRAWIQLSALYRLLQPRILLWRARRVGLSERLLLGDLQEIYVRSRMADALDWKLLGALVARMRETAEREGARFFFFEHPEVAEIWPPYIEIVRERFGVPEATYDSFAVEKRLAAVAEARGVEFLPTVQAFRDAEALGPFHLLPHDPHLNREGHALLAQVLADAIAKPPAAAPPAGAPSGGLSPEIGSTARRRPRGRPRGASRPRSGRRAGWGTPRCTSNRRGWFPSSKARGRRRRPRPPP